MNLSEYAAYDALGLVELVRHGEVRPRELAELALAGVEKANPRLNCVLETLPERVETLGDAPAGPLSGVPFLGKDLPFEKGVRAEMGSALAEGFVCPFDTELAVRLRRAGAANLGRTTTSEFAMAAATENRVTGRTGNPWDPDRSAAGSSGGAAAAVACGAVPFAQGSDAGGSIRMPSSFCGLVGLKPSRTRVPLAPAPPLAYSGLNVAFVLTRSVRDCAAILDTVEGPAVGDGIEIARPGQPYRSVIERPPERLRVAFTARAWSGLPVDAALVEAVGKTAQLCRELGHMVEEATPVFDYEPYIAAQKTIWFSYVNHDVQDVAEVLGRTPGPDNLQSTTWDAYLKGQRIGSRDLLSALDTYSDVTRQIGTFFSGYDVLLTPTCTITPRPLGTFDPDAPGASGDDLFDQLAPHETFTALFNATGQPAITLPLQHSAGGLPMGMQFAGSFGNEETLLRLAAQLEHARPWHDRRPIVHVSA